MAGTLVLAAEGLVLIEAVSAGDIVWAEDPESGEQSLSSVVQTFENETEELVHVTVEGDTITSTPHHPFYSPVKGWTDAADLRAGDILVRSNGEYVIVEQVQHEILKNPVKVYNFEVQDYHTYYAGCREVLVHNMCGNKINPLDEIKYTSKVMRQMQTGDYHSFPKSVDGFGADGKITMIKGGDGVVRKMIEISGSYRMKAGVFQYILEPDGRTCNHRIFVPK